MKRSEINRLLERAMGFFKKMGWYLPPFAFYPAQDWSSIINDEDKSRMHSQILNKCLGWDVTDFGSGEFEQEGLLLFTLRNGDMGTSRSYAEKIMLVEEDQVTPWHYHWQKSEDIINRGGGNLVLELYWAAEVERKSPMDPQVEGEFNTEKSI